LLPNMTLISNSVEALAEPTNARTMLMLEQVDPLTINTDVITSISLNNGVNYEPVTLEKVGNFASTTELWAGVEELVDRNDKTIKIKVETANNKSVKVYGWGVLWS